MGIFLLVGLLFAKLSAFHVYEHHNLADGNMEQCELCILAIDNQRTEIANFSIEAFTEPYSQGDYAPGIYFKSVQIPKTALEFHHCSRPPPSFI